jgi:hypothetical protein
MARRQLRHALGTQSSRANGLREKTDFARQFKLIWAVQSSGEK